MSTEKNRRSLGFELLGDRSLPSTLFITSAFIPPYEQTVLDVRARSDAGERLVRGVNLGIQLGDGSGSVREPVFTDLSYEDTIWSAYPTITGGGVVEEEPQYIQSYVALADSDDPSLMAQGVVARLTVDPQDITTGAFEIHLKGTPFPDSNFLGVPANVINGQITIASPGDATLDGAFNSKDLIQVFIRGEYQDNVQNNSDWADGDWNNDGEFDSRDLVDAFANGRYVRE